VDKSSLSVNKPAKLPSRTGFPPTAPRSLAPADKQPDRQHFGTRLLSSAARSKQTKDYRKALEALARELVDVKEHERRKLADQLHDNFSQDLFLARVKLGKLMHLPQPDRACVEEIDELIASLIWRTRKAIHTLSSQHVCEDGLGAALQALMGEIKAKHGLVCSGRLEVPPRALKQQVQQLLYRSVRELVFNVVKHANAARVEISMTCTSDFIVIEVADNGRGFTADETALSALSIGRFGLFSVRAGLTAVGGGLRIFSRIGKGTRAVITLPIENDRNLLDRSRSTSSSARSEPY
jgi:signal transduction histidine kinase